VLKLRTVYSAETAHSIQCCSTPSNYRRLIAMKLIFLKATSKNSQVQLLPHGTCWASHCFEPQPEFPSVDYFRRPSASFSSHPHNLFLHKGLCSTKLLFLEPERCCVRFQVHKAASMKMTAFWAIAPCSLVDVGDSTHLRNVGVVQRDCTALYPRII
jgi:hypothetical protein